MHIDDSQRSRVASRTYVSMVADKYRKDYQVPGMPYQTGGIRSTILWPTAMTCMRIIPGYDEGNGEVFRQNKNCTMFTSDYDPHDYITDTLCELRTLGGFGQNRNNVISSYKPGSPEHSRWGGDTVLSWFTSDINHAVAAAKDGKASKLVADPDWFGWVSYNKDTKVMPILPFDRRTVLMQALVWTLNGRENMGPDRIPLQDENGVTLPMLYVIGIDNVLSMQEFYKAVVEPQDPSQPLDGKSNNKFRGILEQDGSILYLLPTKRAGNNRTQNCLQPHVSSNASDWNYCPMPLSDDQVHQLWHPWDDVLNYMTPEQQLQLIVDSFPDGAHLVNYFMANNATLKDLAVPDNIARAGFGKYAKYLGGCVELHENQPARPAMPKGFGLPGAQPKQAPAPAPKPPAFVMPGATPAKAATAAAGVTKATGITSADAEVMRQIMQAGASSSEEDELANLAGELLVDDGSGDVFPTFKSYPKQ